ncbi:VTT domain-containing protein [Weissella diestrammenae]|uniref:VTT domain-containing protein n=2 Tax=Weissella diestrammenae TaxID=1162633 RepID=A0A7G9T7K0_9LACO|nr:VTT domain-containing protein [Weissella diestrammenae]QNN76075.1 VTT domain-containing protein [Weissella diestrammenae]
MTVLAVDLPNWLNQIINVKSGFGLLEFSIFFALIFIETGGIFIGWIPGDALLVTIGSIVGLHHNLIELFILMGVFAIASLLGDAVNYFFGAWLLRQGRRIKFIDRHLNGRLMQRLSNSFHHRRWLLFIVAGRFIPFIRTAVPLTAHQLGLAFIDYIRLAAFASSVWSVTLLSIGYTFGQFELPAWLHWSIILLLLFCFGISLAIPKVREQIIRLFLEEK